MNSRKSKEDLKTEFERKLNEGHNLVDYFLTIGVNPDIFINQWLYESSIQELNSKYKEQLKPIIINRFPLIDKSIVGIDEQAIIEHCFPHGFEVIECPDPQQPGTKEFSIVLDNNNYSQTHQLKYLICLKFYESISNYRK